MPGASLLSFSTEDIPDRDRLPLWREVFARSVVKVDLTPLGDSPFRSESRVRLLPGVTIRRSQATAAEVVRTRPLVADGDDNWVFTIIRSGRMEAGQGGREVLLDGGGAYLWTNERTGFARNPTPMDLVTIAFPRAALASSVADIDRALMNLVPASNEALRLLVGYAAVLQDPSVGLGPELGALGASHVRDLAALALGATRDAAHGAAQGGLRAARLVAIKAHIAARLTQPELSAESVAAYHGISPRYLRALFEAEHTSFSDHLREQRLRRAHAMLSSSNFAALGVSAIAYDCGFGDLSHFNHVFRRRYGATPSDVRATAQAHAGRR